MDKNRTWGGHTYTPCCCCHFSRCWQRRRQHEDIALIGLHGCVCKKTRSQASTLYPNNHPCKLSSAHSIQKLSASLNRIPVLPWPDYVSNWKRLHCLLAQQHYGRCLCASPVESFFSWTTYFLNVMRRHVFEDAS